MTGPLHFVRRCFGSIFGIGRVGPGRIFARALRLRKRPVVAIFSLIFVVGASWISFEKYLSLTEPMPERGGEYVEGIVGNRSQLNDIITRLTSAGLVSINAERKIVPVLTKEWTISTDGKTYTFLLFSGIDSGELAPILRNEALFKTVEFKTPDAGTLIARLKQPFGPFLSLLALPLFPYGPFQIEEEADDRAVFVRNPVFPHAPYLERISVRIYPDNKALQRAISQRELSGAVTDESIDSWIRYESDLPRSIMLLFNAERPVMRDVASRTRMLSKEQFAEQATLTLVTTPQLKPSAEPIIDQWRQQNINVLLKVVEDVIMRESIIPKRDYDALIYGVDFGIELDPYRFWHSSQATETGLNLAQLKDPLLDAMLEEARKITDDNLRFARYQEIEKKIDGLAIRTILKQMTTAYQVHPKIRGIELPFMVNSASRYNLVWKWYTNERRELKSRQKQ